MKRIYILAPLFLALSSFVVFGTYKTTGGHPSNTGGPGEGTCADATTGCHSNATVTQDSTNVVNQLVFSGDSTYSPGKKYTITIKTQKSGIEKFGFEVVALTKSTNANTGTWTITDATRTHTLVGSGSLSSRKYVTHSTAGTPAVSSGLGQWSFDWTAPATNVGDIVFYYSTNCTNKNNANTDDQLFLSSYRISMVWPVSIATLVKDKKLNVTYDPSARRLTLNYFLTAEAKVTVSVSDIEGKIVQSYPVTQKNSGNVSEEFELRTNLSKGIYLITLAVNDQTLSEKFLVQ